MQAEPGQVAIEVLAVFGGGEVAVVLAPIGDRAADAMNELADAVLALGRVDLAVEILADDDVRGQLAPGLGNFAVGLLEEHVARFVLDGGGAIGVPLDRVERIGDVGGAEYRFDAQPVRPAAGVRPCGWWLRRELVLETCFMLLSSALAMDQLLLVEKTPEHPMPCTSGFPA